MNRTGVLVVGLFGLAVLDACGGGDASSQPPPPLTVAISLQPTSLAAIDGGQKASVTATVSGDSEAHGVNWTVVCPAGITSCGTMTLTKSASGAANAFQSNAAAGVSQMVKVTATSVLDPSKSQSVSVTVNPPPAAAAESPQSAVVGTPFSISITKLVEGGTPPVSCASAGGSLPAGLSFDPASGQVSGVPSSVAAATTVRYSCTDSASPPMMLATDLAISFQVLAAAMGTPFQMTYARFASTATLLSSGSVLVAGGSTSVTPSDMGPLVMLTWYPVADSATASAEVFDPASSTFTWAGPLKMSRFQHTATLLADGRVLLAGGGNASLPPFAEVYDPGTGLFAMTGAMMSQRRQHTATALKDGRVLFVGGVDESEQPLASAEIYDPSTGRFLSTGAMSTARTLHAAVLLGDGRVLVTGGSALLTSDGGHLILGLLPLASAEIFDPGNGHFTPAGTMIAARISHTATSLPATSKFPAGFVLLAGGLGKSFSPLASAEIYDPGTGAFAMISDMGFARLRHSATLRSDGTALLAGGGNELVVTCFHTHGPPCGGGGPPPTALAPTASIELFNPMTLAFTPYGTLREARDGHVATLLQNGVLFVAGGEVLDRDYSTGVARLKRGGGSYIEFLAAVASAEAIP